MRKVLFLSVCAFALLLAPVAKAGTYEFSDLIDYWGPLGIDARPIIEGIPFSYSHDLTQEVDFISGDQIVSASLELDFTNDTSDDVKKYLGVIIKDYREFVQVGFDGTNWVDIGEVDNGQYLLSLNIDWLNDDGFLDVTVSVSNPGSAMFPGGIATAYLDHSRVFGTASAVPEPSSLMLLGSGILALGFAARKRMKK